jgi:hypothetical protein
MYALARHRLTLFSILSILILVVAVACTDDDDDRDPGAPAGTGEGTPSADFGVPTPDPDATPDPEETPEHYFGGAEREPGERLTPEAAPPDPDATPPLPAPETPIDEPLAERTVTPDTDVVGPEEEGIFPDVRAEGLPFDNYTMTITGEINVTPTDVDENGPATIDLRYEQAAPDSFYLMFDGDDEFVVETWRDGDQLWVRDPDEDVVMENTDELAADFDISVYLTMLPEIDRITDAEEVGQEEIDGRTTTQYTIPAAEAVQYMPGMQDIDFHDAEGSMDIWLAEDENAVMRMTVDLTWMDANDNENSVEIEYEITDIDETADIEVPEE